MENFVVSARKYRPATFKTVVGQESITSTLKNAIKNNHLAQAFLFCGPRGVGKTTCARILAKTINCTNLTAETEACDTCVSCTSFNSGQSLNVYELDAASNNSVDDIRNLVDQVRFAPQLGKYKVYIIDEVHMLSTAAFNAFLKTLEEPPKHAIFILATTEKHKIIPTILSRCQIFDFNRIQIDDIANHLAFIASNEGVSAEKDALHIIAQKADGALRDACSMFDQLVSFAGNTITYKAVIENLNILDYDYYFKVTDALLEENIPKALLIYNEILNNGFDGQNFLSGLGEHLRNLLVAKDVSTLQLLEVGETIKERYKTQSAKSALNFLLRGLAILNRGEQNYKGSKNPRLQVELTLMQLCSILSGEAEKKNDIISPPRAHLEGVAGVNSIATNGSTSAGAVTVGAAGVGAAGAAGTAGVGGVGAAGVAVAAGAAGTAGVGGAGVAGTAGVGGVGAAGTAGVGGVGLGAAGTGGAVSKDVPEKSTTGFKKSLLGSASPSIGQFLQETKKVIPSNVDSVNASESVKISEAQLAHSFSQDELETAWGNLCNYLEQKGKFSLFSTLSYRKPLLKNNFVLEFCIDNTVQKEEIESEKMNLLGFLRKELRNFSISLETIITVDDRERKPYTAGDKFKRMSEKNPSIIKLKQLFDLDLDL